MLRRGVMIGVTSDATGGVIIGVTSDATSGVDDRSDLRCYGGTVARMRCFSCRQSGAPIHSS
jgi:hypothetical protein